MLAGKAANTRSKYIATSIWPSWKARNSLRRFQRALCQKPAVKRLEQDRGERCPQHRLEERQYDRQQRQRYEREEQQKSALFDLPCFRMIVQDVQRPAIDAVANGDKAAGVRLGLVLNMSRGPASPNSILPVVAH